MKPFLKNDERGVEILTDNPTGVINHIKAVISKEYPSLAKEEDFDDIVQDIYLKAWKSKNTFKGESQFLSWLNIIIINHCKTIFASSYHKYKPLLQSGTATDESGYSLFDKMPTDSKSPYKYTLEQQEMKLLQTLLETAELVKAQLPALLLRLDEEMPYDQIAQELGLRSTDTAKTSVFMAKKKLKIAAEKLGVTN